MMTNEEVNQMQTLKDECNDLRDKLTAANTQLKTTRRQLQDLQSKVEERLRCIRALADDVDL